MTDYQRSICKKLINGCKNDVDKLPPQDVNLAIDLAIQEGWLRYSPNNLKQIIPTELGRRTFAFPWNGIWTWVAGASSLIGLIYQLTHR